MKAPEWGEGDIIETVCWGLENPQVIVNGIPAAVYLRRTVPRLYVSRSAAERAKTGPERVVPVRVRVCYPRSGK